MRQLIFEADIVRSGEYGLMQNTGSDALKRKAISSLSYGIEEVKQKMNAYKCDRCGTLFERDSVPERSIAIKHSPYGFECLDLCPKCQEELENWIDGVQFDSSLNPTLRNGA